MNQQLLKDIEIPNIDTNARNKRSESSIISTSQLITDPHDILSYPANINHAKNHGLASRIKQKTLLNDNNTINVADVCPCCDEPVQNELIPICAHNYRALYHLGYCYPLYYHFVKYCVILLSFCTIVSGTYSMFSNYYLATKILPNTILNAQQASLPDIDTTVAIATFTSNTTTNNISSNAYDLNMGMIYNISALPGLLILYINNEIIGVNDPTNIDADGEDWVNTMEILKYQSILNLLCVAWMMIFFQCFKEQQTKIVWDAHNENITPGDYTLMIEGLSGFVYTQDDIINYLKENGLCNNDDDELQVKKINITWNVDKLLKLSQQRIDKAKERKVVIKELTKYENNPEPIHAAAHSKLVNIKNNYETEIADLEKQIIDLTEQYRDGKLQNQLSGVVFITYNSYKQAKVIKKLFKANNNPCLYYLNTNTSLPKFKGKSIRIKRAPEPTDVYWENLHFGGKALTARRIRGHMISCIIILLSFCLIFGINMFKSSEGSSGINEYLTMVCSIFIVIINSLLNMVIRKISHEEKPKSHTHFNALVAEKLSVAKFLNSALVPFVVQLLQSQYLKQVIFGVDTGSTATAISNLHDLNTVLHSVVYNMFSILISNTFVTPLLVYLDVSWYMKKYNQKKLEEQADHNNNVPLTQYEANQIYEGLQVDMALKYSNIINTMFVTAFYAPMLPIGLLISIIGLFLNYYIDKITLLRRCSTPLELGKELSKIMTNYLEIFPLLYIIGNSFPVMIIILEVNDLDIVSNMLSISLFGFFTALLIIVLPVRHIHKLVNNRRLNTGFKHDLKYDDLWLIFDSDYDRTNPITKTEAESAYLQGLLRHEKSTNKQNYLNQKVDEIKNNTGSGYTGNYFKPKKPKILKQSRSENQKDRVLRLKNAAKQDC